MQGSSVFFKQDATIFLPVYLYDFYCTKWLVLSIIGRVSAMYAKNKSWIFEKVFIFKLKETANYMH